MSIEYRVTRCAPAAAQNIPFLINVMSDENFLKGDLNTRYIENNPQLLTLKEDNDLAHKLIYYLAEVNANGAGFSSLLFLKWKTSCAWSRHIVFATDPH
jgi:pyruvate carboxylase